MEAKPTSELEKELSDLVGALDKGIQKLRCSVRNGHAVGQALGALANALDAALREHGEASREKAGRDYLKSVGLEPEDVPAVKRETPRESEQISLVPAEVERIAADLAEVKAAEPVGSA